MDGNVSRDRWDGTDSVGVGVTVTFTDVLVWSGTVVDTGCDVVTEKVLKHAAIDGICRIGSHVRG
jgi:hypothetical protein